MYIQNWLATLKLLPGITAILIFASGHFAERLYIESLFIFAMLLLLQDSGRKCPQILLEHDFWLFLGFLILLSLFLHQKVMYKSHLIRKQGLSFSCVTLLGNVDLVYVRYANHI